MAATKFVATLLLIMLSVQTASAQLSIIATTFPDAGNGKANTFLAPSDAIGSSLLGTGVPALLWLSVKSSDVTTLCQQIVSKGLLSFSVTVTDSVAGTQDILTVQVESTIGCEAAPDELGTEFVWVDSKGRRSALVCPNNAGTIGCGVYMMSDGITQYDNEETAGHLRLFSMQSRRQLVQCSGDAIIGGKYWTAVEKFLQDRFTFFV